MELAKTTTKGVRGRRGEDRKKAVSKSTKAELQFLVGWIGRFLKKGRYAQRIGVGAPVYLAAILEYLAAKCWSWQEMQHVATRRPGSTPWHVLLVVRNDEELRKLLQGVTNASGGVLPNINPMGK